MSLQALLERVWAREDLADLDPAERRLALREVVLEDGAGSEVAAELADFIDGFGPLTEHMCDGSVTDILVNGPQEVWIERTGELSRSPAGFENVDVLSRFLSRLAHEAGVQLDPSHPMADFRLSDGSRIHVAVPPVAPTGPLVSIRRFRSSLISLDDLVDGGMLGGAEAARLTRSVLERSSILISGRTGSGKTTLLNALLNLVPATERVVLIEETRELKPSIGHHVNLVARPANLEGRGAISMAQLVTNALRMRPDRIVVGEVRGSEASAALHAMSTGHPGSMLTIHAGDPAEALDRFAALAASTSFDVETARSWADRAIDVIVQLARIDGRRVVTQISGG
jgi:pilus assembly protein CpaF